MSFALAFIVAPVVALAAWRWYDAPMWALVAIGAAQVLVVLYVVLPGVKAREERMSATNPEAYRRAIDRRRGKSTPYSVSAAGVLQAVAKRSAKAARRRRFADLESERLMNEIESRDQS